MKGFQRTSEAKYWEMLEVLPPADMWGGGFLVGEPIDHNASGFPRYEAFIERPAGMFWVGNRPMTVREFREAVAKEPA